VEVRHRADDLPNAAPVLPLAMLRKKLTAIPISLLKYLTTRDILKGEGVYR